MIDEARIKENLELISFPRLSGTDGEKRVFNLVKNKVEALNLEHSVQNFSFTSFYPRVYQKIVLILSFWAIFILYLNSDFIFTILNLIIILAIFLPSAIITRKPENIRIGKKRDSQNLFVKILGDSAISYSNYKVSNQDNARGNLIFICHLDSKGQLLPIKFRIFFFKLWIYSSTCCLILIFLKNIILVQYSFYFYIAGAIPLFLNLIATIALSLNITNNKSFGAIDNAAGIVCVLELLNYYSNSNGLKNYNLWFLFTGAEETGMMGIRHFYHKIKHLNRTKSFMLNFDTIGTHIDVITGERGRIFFQNIKDFTITFHLPRRIRFTGSDAYYLADNGFHGFGVLDIQSYKYVHSKHDTTEKVDCLLLAKLLKQITIMIKGIDK